MTAEIVDLAERRAARHAKCEKYGAFRPETSFTQERLKPDEPRVEPRHEVEGICVPALTLNGKAAVLRNVSRSGFMAAVELDAAPGARLVADVAGFRPVSARLIWKRDGLIGLQLPFGTMELLRQ